MSDELNQLELAELWALFGRLADPEGIPAGTRDPKHREQLRKLDAGVYVADPVECRSRRVVITATGIDEVPTVELPPEPDWELGAPAMWVDQASVRVGRD
ncbi:MAG: hypothetical protein GY898_16415 [Proteobacteria bacterium]|nr:hypothetical protein [Pseudomonadota bacterium]